MSTEKKKSNSDDKNQPANDEKQKGNAAGPVKRVSDARLKIYFDLIKWFFVSVVLAVFFKLIETSFKDREIGIKELGEYSKHLDLIIDFNKVSERILLAQYFSYVTPSEKLRERWSEYYRVVKAEFDELQKEKQNVVASIKNLGINPNTNQLLDLEIRYNELQNKLTPRFKRKFEITENEDMLYHLARPFETVEQIAEKYNLSREKLIELNPSLSNKELNSAFKTGAPIRVK